MNLISGHDVVFSKGLTGLISSFIRFVLHMKDREEKKLTWWYSISAFHTHGVGGGHAVHGNFLSQTLVNIN